MDTWRMFFQMIRQALRTGLCAIILSGLVAPALSKTYIFKLTGQETPILLPDNWTVGSIASGIEIKSGDEEVYLWVQAVTGATVMRAVDEYFSYYKKQGVTFTGPPIEKSDEIAGHPVSILVASATFEGAPTFISFVFSDPKDGAKKGLLIGYWASPAGATTHEKAVNRIMDDLFRP